MAGWQTTTTPEGLTVHTWDAAPDGAPTLLLLHGLTDNGEAWADAAQRWGDRWRVVCPDGLGHGRSRRFTASELASEDPMGAAYDALSALLTSLAAGDDRGVVVGGHSMGGGLATALAARHPDLVRAALLEDPVWREEPDERELRMAATSRVAEAVRARDDLEGVLADGRRRNPEWPESEMEPWARAKAEGDLDFLRSGRALLAQPWQEMAAALAVPTLVVTGDHDVIIDAATRREIEALGNPLIRVEEVAGAWHCVRRSQGTRFHAVVDPWLEELRTA